MTDQEFVVIKQCVARAVMDSVGEPTLSAKIMQPLLELRSALDRANKLIGESADELRRLAEENQRLTTMLGIDTSWPVDEVLRELADAADHLLTVHSCDTHGHEGIRYAERAARQILAALAAAGSKGGGSDCVRCHGSGRIDPDTWCPVCKGAGTQKRADAAAGSKPMKLFPLIRDQYRGPDLDYVAMLPEGVPWALVAPHETQAQKNHGQSLSRLAERGGLAVSELLAVIEDRDWRHIPLSVAILQLQVILDKENP